MNNDGGAGDALHLTERAMRNPISGAREAAKQAGGR
jgi:hypothetical protein